MSYCDVNARYMKTYITTRHIITATYRQHARYHRKFIRQMTMQTAYLTISKNRLQISHISFVGDSLSDSNGTRQCRIDCVHRIKALVPILRYNSLEERYR